MKKVLFLYLLFSSILFAKNIKVATYNVENLFDLQYNGTEYEEYRPNTKTWNKRAFHTKIDNISQVIQDLNADILGLQEIESEIALKSLLLKNKQYKYFKFLKKKTASIGVAIISKYPIKKWYKIPVDKNDKYARYLLKVIVDIQGKELILYVNHWRSKKAKESKRIIYATSLKKELNSLNENDDYIILGDFNSNYNEYLTFKYNKKLNNTFGITGINQILNTTYNKNFILKKNILHIDDVVHYNLWLELDKKDRFSSKFRGEKITPDSIILSKGLFDTFNLSYVDNSFHTFKPKYLIHSNKIYRWNNRKQQGYSDHLPIYAIISTKLQKYNFITDSSHKINKISDLYNKQQVNNFDLENVIVIYKSNKIAILKEKNGRAIMVYKPSEKLKIGYSYKIIVDNIDEFNGLKEIKNISYIKEQLQVTNYKSFYIDGREIDLFNNKYQNEIIKNLRGKYKKGYLYFRHSNYAGKIKLYFDKKIKRPKNGDNITIKSGHLSVYKSKIQIVLHLQNDFIIR